MAIPISPTPAPRDPERAQGAEPDPAPKAKPARDLSVAARLSRVGIVMVGIAAAIVAAVAIALPGITKSGHASQANVQTSLASKQMAANKQWASATCTNILAWKKQISSDETHLLSLNAIAHVNDAIAATTRMLNEEDRLGLPPGAQTAQARQEASRLRSDIEARLNTIKADASSVASGNFGEVPTLLGDLSKDQAVAPQVVNELRHVLTVDLGLSLAETSACRQLVGIPI